MTRSRPLHDGEAGDALTEGFSLVELIVAMAILTVFTAIFLVAVAGLARGTTQARVTAESSSGALIVFQNIDRQVRYADAINYPGLGLTTGYRYIEFRTPASSMPSGVTTCNQWRYLPDLNRIESRRWNDTAGSVATPWSTKLTSVIAQAEVTYPFELIPGAGEEKQQLKLTLHAGSSNTQVDSSIATTFLARNSANSMTNAVDASGFSATPVCGRTEVVRP